MIEPSEGSIVQVTESSTSNAMSTLTTADSNVIKEYVREHSNGMKEMQETVDVSLKKIEKFIEDSKVDQEELVSRILDKLMECMTLAQKKATMQLDSMMHPPAVEKPEEDLSFTRMLIVGNEYSI